MPREIIVHKYRSYLSGRTNVDYEMSDNNGIFQSAHITTAHETEEYRIYMKSTYGKLGAVRRLNPLQVKRYFEISDQIQELYQKKKEILEAAATSGQIVTLNWMRRHQRKTSTIPKEFESKKRIKRLRKGTLMVIDCGRSDYARWIGVTGKLKRFNPKTATLELKGDRLISVPYAYLKRATVENKRKAKKNKRLAEIGAKVVGQFNRIVK